MKIAIAGMGYVGLANGILLAQYHEVTNLDIIFEKVTMLNQRKYPISDHEIEVNLLKKNLNIRATFNPETAYAKAEVIKDLSEFKNKSDVIVAIRITEDIKDVLPKVYTRDLFSRD